MSRRLALVVTATAGALLLSACSGSTDAGPTASADGRPSVVAAFYPLQYAAEAVGGDAVSVTSLTPPGVEPHDLELSAQQVAQIADADVVLYVKGFQPAVDEAVAQQAADRAIDVSAGLTLLADDPHVWLDPRNMAAIGSSIAQRLATLDPALESTVTANAGTLTTEMDNLDAAYRTGLQQCRSDQLVVSHEAFGYLAAAYGLTQIGISGLSPDAEPSPARMKEVADLVTANGVTTIYYETLVDPKVAETIAAETGATAAVLDPLEGLAEGSTGDYPSIMEQNLATLQSGQGCT